MTFRWPEGFPRVHDEDWTRDPVRSLARKYDTVESHGWYDNLDPTVEQLDDWLREGDVVMDYSGGTGILAERILQALDERRFGVLIVDSSPKFLRLALDKLGADERVAFRRIRFLRDERRLQRIEEVVEPPLRQRGVEAVVSTNAIHLYYDLPETLESWACILRPGCRAFVQSGNIANPERPADHWIIDETVETIHEAAVDIVREADIYRDYRDVLDDAERMASYADLRRKYFLPVRPLDHYVEALEAAGFGDLDVSYRPIDVKVDQWLEFLRAYHEGVLGWVGGAEKIEGKPADEGAVRDRVRLLGEATHRAFGGQEGFVAGWTYVVGSVPGQRP